MMSEGIPTCEFHKKYSWIKCANPALPGDPDCLCILHSQDPAKDPAAFRDALQGIWNKEDSEYYDFRVVFFPGRFAPQDFFGSREFSKPVKFSMATFAERADFSRATFTAEAYFRGATFTEVSDFHGATFTAEAIFSGATFKERAAFSGVTFKERANFFRATFKERANFSRATFKEEADFSRATFEKAANFSGAIIAGRLLFDSINPGEEGEPQPRPFNGIFFTLQLQDQGLLRFRDVSLAQVRFAGTDLRRPQFHHVAWHAYRGRRAIYDEVLLRQKEKERPWFRTWLCCHAPYAQPPSSWMDRYGEAERLYRNLKKNYEESGDFKNAGDFHYGEMEMHRRASKWRWFPFYWYNLYWALSGYGERPTRALSWLAIFLAVFTGSLAWAGLQIIDPKYSASFGNSFFYLLQKATLQRPTWAEPMGFWGKLVAGFSVFLIPGQAALFLLALRNRLGRRR